MVIHCGVLSVPTRRKNIRGFRSPWEAFSPKPSKPGVLGHQDTSSLGFPGRWRGAQGLLGWEPDRGQEPDLTYSQGALIPPAGLAWNQRPPYCPLLRECHTTRQPALSHPPRRRRALANPWVRDTPWGCSSESRVLHARPFASSLSIWSSHSCHPGFPASDSQILVSLE